MLILNRCFLKRQMVAASLVLNYDKNDLIENGISKRLQLSTKKTLVELNVGTFSIQPM